MSMTFGGVGQLGYVVRDLHAAMRHWVRIGVGPWFYKEDAICSEFRYHGKECGDLTLSNAVAQSGNLQIELIQQKTDTPSVFLDTLAVNGEVAQHIAFWTMDRFDEHCAEFLRLGYREVHFGRMGQAPRGRFAYFVHPDLPSGMFEVSEQTGGKAEYFEKVRHASVGWDGKDPFRPAASLS